MTVEYTPARLAELTGLPNLETVVDPERLESLIGTAQGMQRHLVPGCPLRYRDALRQYEREAAAILADPQTLR